MAIREILLLGDERLYKKAKPLSDQDMEKARRISRDLEDTMMNFRREKGFGRAIAAPQINEPYRLIFVHVQGRSTTMVNPELICDGETYEIWDDCMSFPGLEVKVLRYRQCVIRFNNLHGKKQQWSLKGDMAELLQHEYDHLNGILAVDRALNKKAFRIVKK